MKVGVVWQRRREGRTNRLMQQKDEAGRGKGMSRSHHSLHVQESDGRAGVAADW